MDPRNGLDDFTVEKRKPWSNLEYCPVVGREDLPVGVPLFDVERSTDGNDGLLASALEKRPKSLRWL